MGSRSPFTIQHELEQLQYLASRRARADRLAPHAELVAKALAIVRRLNSGTLRAHPGLEELLLGTLPRLENFYRPAGMSESALSSRLRAQDIEDQFRRSPFPWVVVDDLLSPVAHQRLLRLARESTVWRESKGEDVVAARMESGLDCGLIRQISRELPVRFPSIFAGAPFQQAWAFKFGPRSRGLDVHADGGSVTVNLWLTPAPTGSAGRAGGMRIHRAVAPRGWSLKDSNSPVSVSRIRELLHSGTREFSDVEYRANRAVIFHSRLFHESVPGHFANRYVNRRVNLTLLFGAWG